MSFTIRPYCTLLLVLLAACNVESFEEKQAKETAKREAIHAETQGKLDEIAKAFQQKYNTGPSWMDRIKNKPITTYALQKALIRSDHRPVLAGGILFDGKKGGKDIVLSFRIPGFEWNYLRQQY